MYQISKEERFFASVGLGAIITEVVDMVTVLRGAVSKKNTVYKKEWKPLKKIQD